MRLGQRELIRASGEVITPREYGVHALLADVPAVAWPAPIACHPRDVPVALDLSMPRSRIAFDATGLTPPLRVSLEGAVERGLDRP